MMTSRVPTLPLIKDCMCSSGKLHGHREEGSASVESDSDPMSMLLQLLLLG
jgi:hypothetical protein